MIQMNQLTNSIHNQRAIIEWYADNHDTAAGKAYGHTAYAAFVALSVSNGGGKTPTILTHQSQTSKTDMNKSEEWEQLIRYLMAANRSGIVNLCPHSTPECRAGCLGHTSGRLRYSAQQKAQYIRTLFLAQNPAFFHVVELMEMKRNAKRINKKGKKAVARLNGTSDIPYEEIGWYLACLKKMGLDLLFDYTANKTRTRGWIHNLPLPYHLTHSTKETDHPNSVAPGSYTVVAVKRHAPLPTKYNGHPVFDGDTSDMRFLDPEGHVALGRGKGALKNQQGDAQSFLKPATHKHNGSQVVTVNIIPRINKKVNA